MKNQRGQVLIVAILILLVVSFILLAATSRTITDIKISETNDESQRAFFAAETGVEEAMEQIRQGVITASSGSKSLPNQSDYSYTVSQQGTNDVAFLSPSPLTSDIQTFQVYLANRDDPATAANELDTGNYAGPHVCLIWGNPGAPQMPAIEAMVVYKKTDGTVVSERFAIDPDGTRRTSNNFAPVNPGTPSCPTAIVASENNLGIDRTFAFAHKLALDSTTLPNIATTCDTGAAPCVYYLRMRLLYSQSEPQYVGVSRHNVGFNLPPQGYKIASTGTAGGATGATRKMEIFRFYESLPSVFDFAMFNGCTNPPSCSDVIKN